MFGVRGKCHDRFSCVETITTISNRLFIPSPVGLLMFLLGFSLKFCGGLQLGFVTNQGIRCLTYCKPNRKSNGLLYGRLEYLARKKLDTAISRSCMVSVATDEFETDKSPLCESSIVSFNWTSPTLAIAIPALIGMIADPLLSLMDTIYVSQLGSVELAALGPCTSIFHLAFNAFRATTAATTSLISVSLQEGQNTTSSMQLEPNDNAKDVLSTTMCFFALMGVFVAFTLITTSEFALSCMGVSSASSLYPHGTCQIPDQLFCVELNLVTHLFYPLCFIIFSNIVPENSSFGCSCRAFDHR